MPEGEPFNNLAEAIWKQIEKTELFDNEVIQVLQETIDRARREQLANAQHAIWAHWMEYQLSVCERNEDGSVTIPVEKVERWERQVATNYSDLTEKEKDSDRGIVDKFLSDIL